ncbi:iron-siderophore ABC transporter substrate-binding protein [Rhodococcus sp. NPDC060086]|uniref:iron-siderophore ABC transporter substrate-binding protein n=1 Tax=unclassified Rhodococcus (in: high G+C Gram-positive bacteria) TaxID=192944 RepID=UPI00365ABBCD
MAALAACGLVIGLAGCSSSDDGADTASAPAESNGAFPVQITSPLGVADIEAAPQRVATWGWSNQDAILALGVVPVAMPTFEGPQYGSDDAGVLKWDADALEELGADTPILLSGDGTGEAPIEQFAAADPDLIFAPYSGLTQQEFDALSEIAPVVAYPEDPWTASWEEQLSIAGQALGKQAEATAILDSVNTEIADAAAKYPALAGKTVTIALPTGPDTFAVSKSADVRVEFLEQLGLVNEPTIQEADPDSDPTAVYFELSYEKAALIQSDVLFVVAYDKESLNSFLASPVVATLPVVSEGRTASTKDFSVDKNFAFGGLTVLTIPYILDDVASVLNSAAENVNG